MRRILHENGLSIVLFSAFLLTLAGQYFTGWHEYNEDQREHGRAAVSAAEYFGEGHFIEAVFENWESEFLQMGAYVYLTVWLYQKGSSESKKPGVTERVDIILPESLQKDETPSPVRRGGLALKLYQNSLTIVLLSLFIVSFWLHAFGGAKTYNEEQAEHGSAERVSVVQYVGTSRFWFESLQNWQSEFFSIGMMVVLSIWLRQKGSPESKPVDAPHGETGSD